MPKLGFFFPKAAKNLIQAERLTRESKIKLTLDFGPRREGKIDLGINFLNHMIETIAWRSSLNIDVSYENNQFRLIHVIAEDVGIVLGKGFLKAIELRMKEGVKGAGGEIAGLDEALAIAAVSFEGRANTYLDLEEAPGAQIKLVEDTSAGDLFAFFEGFSQGAKATVNIKLFKGKNPHHAWEAAFRAFGEALKKALEPCSFRKETTAGVKGILE